MLFAALAFFCAPGLVAATAIDVSKLPPSADRKIDFVKDIQPILAKSCYSCHGPDRQKAELRWDVRAIALKGSEHGPVIVPGKSAESRMIQLVAGVEKDMVMPQKGERLTAEQVGLLRAWIDQGANWPDGLDPKGADKRNHWAFKAPVRPPVPTVNNKQWVRNAIDNFVLTRLEQDKLKPSPEADRVTLIRRLSLDLTGLPPTIAEVDDFLADRSPDAYEKVVERLLKSPHYGECWGRHWLDAARYADTNGYEKDVPRSIWPYRDWVIRAFNRDLPYDEFTIEQLAGDLLPNPTLDQRIATGFLRNSMLNQEGGIEPEQFRVEAMIDRMDAVGKAWLGLTINCCQCHNHKFDPLSQKEYYQLYAFLNNDDEPFLEVPTSSQQKEREDILAKVRELENKAMTETTNLTERLAAWEKSAADAEGNWTVLDPYDWMNFATKFVKLEDASLLGGGDLQRGGEMKFWVDTPLTNITGFRLEVLTNPNLPYGGPGLLGKGNYFLKEFTVNAYPLNNPNVTNTVKFVRAVADEEASGFGITNAIDGDSDKTGWTAAVTPERRNQDHRAVFECKEPVGFVDGTRLFIELHESFKGGEGGLDKDSKLDCHMIGCFRLSVTTNAGPLKADPLTPSQRKALAVAPDQRTSAQQLDLFNAFRLADSSFAAVNKEIDNAFTNWPYPPTTLALQQRKIPRVTHIFKRGDRLRPGEEVQPDVPVILNPFPKDAPRNRLGLAKWIVDRRSPTTARVIVNRIWQSYFGQGLVTTPEDFGTRVEAPSHADLLDWLACEFMDKGWSFKTMHRLIVNSAAYRQSSHVSPELYERDQYNRLLARGPRFRVEAETVQDIAFATSGLLNPKIGGPSVYPPIPASVGDTVYGGFNWPETKGDDRFRRGMYTFWKRSLPFPTLLAFDAPAADTSCTRRLRSNTPLQALTTLNEKTFVEAAQAMALRVMKEGGADERNRATYAFRLCLGRKPTTGELDALMKFWQEQYEYFEDRTAAAVSVALPDPKSLPTDVNLHKVAAWAMVSRAILNLDETITKE